MNRKYSSRKRPPKSRRETNNTLTATILVFVTLCVIAALVVIYIFASNEHDKVDRKTHCLKGSPEAITAILIDHTDHINATQKASLEKRLWDVASTIQKNSLIEVYSVDRIVDHILEPEIRLCNPGDEGSVNDITGNKILTKKSYESKFKDPLIKILNRLVNADTLNESPIMESLQSVTVSAFIGNQNKLSKKKLILVSDLLQNDKEFSIYNGVPNFNNYKKSGHWASVKSDLNDVEIEVYLLRRDSENKLQDSNLWDFWKNYFESQGAVVTHRFAIEG